MLIYPPLIGGINAIVSPSFRSITSPAGTYSSFNANVNESSSNTNMFERFGYFSAIIFLSMQVQKCKYNKIWKSHFHEHFIRKNVLSIHSYRRVTDKTYTAVVIFSWPFTNSNFSHTWIRMYLLNFLPSWGKLLTHFQLPLSLMRTIGL